MNVHVASPPKSRTVDQSIAKFCAAAFWSLRHPLNRAYQRDHGKTVAGVFHPANGFSIRQLIEYAEELPPEILAAYRAEAKEQQYVDKGVMLVPDEWMEIFQTAVEG